MAVSYKSTTFKSSAYVPPISLELMAKVLGTKQQQSDLNFQKEQSRIDELGSLDVIREQDRAYLNNKINSLVSTVNNFGGQDFSDPNVFNQIEGIGSDIYSDNKIINSLTSTKQVRKLMSGYEKYKTDPKLAKLYSSANEFIDNKKVNEWLSNPEVGITYSGASTPTPFVPYKDNMLKALDKVKADYIDNVSVDGYYISKDGTTRITPQRLTAIAAQTLTADEQSQVYRDGAYTYRSTASEQLIQKSLDQYQSKVEEAKSMKLYYESQARSSVDDPNARRNYLQLAADKDNELIALTKDPAQVAKAAMDKYKQDPDSFAGQVYQDDFIGGMANLFSQNKTTRSVTGNPVAMFAERQRSMKEHWDAEYAQKDRQFYDNLQFQAAKEGKRMIVDPITGNITYPSLNSAYSGLQGTIADVENPDNIKVTPENLKKASDENQLQQDQVWTSFLNTYLTENRNLGIKAPSANPNSAGNQLTLKGQKFLEGFNNQSGFQYEDLGAVQSPVVRKQLESAGLKSDQIQLLIDLNRNFKAIIEGKGSTVGQLPKSFVDAASKIAVLKEGQRANKAVLDNAYEKVLSSSPTPLSDEDRKVIKEALDNPKDYKYNFLDNAGISPWIESEKFNQKEANVSKLKAVEKKLGMSIGDIRKEIQKYLDPLSLHSIYRTKIFTEEERKDKTIATFMAGEMNQGHGNFYVDGKKKEAKPLEAVAMKDITPMDAGMMSDGSGAFYVSGQVSFKDGDKEVTGTYVVPVKDDNAKVFGLIRDPYENLNRSVDLTGWSGDIPVYINNDLAIQVTIVRPDISNINSPKYAQAKFYDLDAQGNKIKDSRNPGEYVHTLIKIPNTEGGTASESYVKALESINKAGNNDLKRYDNESFRQLLIEYNKTNR